MPLVIVVHRKFEHRSAPCIPGLGFPTSTRGQMLTLEPNCANSLRGGCRPRTTLSPTVALKDGKLDYAIAFGSPGADGQDQHTLSFFLRHVHHGMAPQKAIDVRCTRGRRTLLHLAMTDVLRILGTQCVLLPFTIFVAQFPSFSSRHMPSSFGGGVYPKVLNLEARIPVSKAQQRQSFRTTCNLWSYQKEA